MSTLRLQGIEKRYHPANRAALESVDLTVPKGSLVALVGESGSGKTTLLRIISGLETPDAGTVSIGDDIVAGPRTFVPPQKRKVGLVFQSGALFPHLTAGANIEFGLKGMGKSERRARAEKFLDLVGLKGYADRIPGELSGGEAQRVALARALAPAPEVLLLDEPFSSLDSALRRRLRDEVRDIFRATGTTALFVTHDSEDALAVADEIAIMREGKLLQMGEPAQLYRNPCDAYCAALFGPVNRLPEGFMSSDQGTGIIHGPADGQVEDGWLWVRPEELDVLPSHGDGSVRVTVRQSRFVGERQELEVVISPVGEAPATDQTLTVYWQGDGTIDQGQTLWIRPR